MDNIIKFKQKSTATGKCICLGCRYEWVGVWPVGITEFECPNCKLIKGTSYGLMYFGNKNQLIRVCECENEFFYLTPEGHMCAKCGTYQSYE